MAEKKHITEEEQKKLLQLWENAQSGTDDEVDAYENFRIELGIGPDEVSEYLSVKQVPETEQEKRLARKGKAGDERRSDDAIEVDKIAEAYGVNLKQASEEGELVPGKLMDYLDERLVMKKGKDESTRDYTDRNRNAFETLGLNWNNVEDRGRVAKSIELASRMDDREALAEDAQGGLFGIFASTVSPRTTERAVNEILTGEESDGYLKDYLLDVAENVLQTAGAPVTAPLKAARGLKAAKAVQKAIKSTKAGKKALDGRTKVNKALKGVGTLAGIGADAAAVPLIMEAADAAAYDDPENIRSEFSGEDALLGAAVNAVTPYMIRRRGQMAGRRFGQDVAGDAGAALSDIGNLVKFNRLEDYAGPWATNKMGRSEFVRSLPGLETIVKETEEEAKLRQKKAEAQWELEEKWSLGFAVPEKGDRNYKKFQEWKKKNRLGKYL